MALSKRPKIGIQDQISLNADQKYCRMHQGEHSAILSTFIKLPVVIKIFEWPFYAGFTVYHQFIFSLVLLKKIHIVGTYWKCLLKMIPGN